MQTLEMPDVLISQLLVDAPDLRDIVEEFVLSLDQRIQELKKAYEELDFADLRTLAHRLKGAGGSYGYPDLSKLAGQMELEFERAEALDFEAELKVLQRMAHAARAGLALPEKA